MEKGRYGTGTFSTYMQRRYVTEVNKLRSYLLLGIFIFMVTTIAICKNVILDQIFSFRFHGCLIPPQRFMPDFKNELPCGIDYQSGINFVRITPLGYQGDIVEEIKYVISQPSDLPLPPPSCRRANSRIASKGIEEEWPPPYLLQKKILLIEKTDEC
jgi:hypothetical protein